MEKYQILVNLENGKFFTDNWGGYWSADMENAKRYSLSEDMNNEIDRLFRSSDSPLDGVYAIEVKIVFVKNY